MTLKPTMLQPATSLGPADDSQHVISSQLPSQTLGPAIRQDRQDLAPPVSHVMRCRCQSCVWQFCPWMRELRLCRYGPQPVRTEGSHLTSCGQRRTGLSELQAVQESRRVPARRLCMLRGTAGQPSDHFCLPQSRFNL